MKRLVLIAEGCPTLGVAAHSVGHVPMLCNVGMVS